MSNRNFQVSLLFNADVSAAQANIQALAQTLQSLKSTPIGFDSGSIAKGVESAKQLQMHLQGALNQSTGKLDLSVLDRSLRASNTSLTGLMSSIKNCGPEGQRAFTQVANAIAQAETPAMRLGEKTKGLLDTLGNTVKWQAASTLIHGVTGSFNEAIRHIEKFDKALTDIKVVSDIDDSALTRFVEKTRQVSKEVGATSLDLVQGSTIYFQQGLNEKQALERSQITQKLSNITGQSVEESAKQMTAIWNNFQEGGKSLEYYADVLSHLSAQTAADADDIASGMEKFAAAADVVGLSYENAAASVALVVDKTQMSAEVVGTAFKTIFSRMQGLKLGETLEDGTDLNKYSEALAAVGVSIKDQNGGLREADVILSDLNDKWKTLDKDQQMALAQTVAGVRQYTQFVGLMDVWDEVEQYANNSAEVMGFLGEKNEEFKGSIEGTKKILEQAKNDFAQALFQSDDLKGFNEVLSVSLTTVAELVDSFGGIVPVLLTVTGLMSRALVPKLIDAGRAIHQNILTGLGIAEQRAQKLRAEFMAMVNKEVSEGNLSTNVATELDLTNQLSATKQRLLDSTKGMASQEKQLVLNKIQLLELETLSVQNALKKKEAVEQELQAQKNLLISQDKGAVGRGLGIKKAEATYGKEQVAMALDTETYSDDKIRNDLKELRKLKEIGAAGSPEDTKYLDQEINKLERIRQIRSEINREKYKVNEDTVVGEKEHVVEEYVSNEKQRPQKELAGEILDGKAGVQRTKYEDDGSAVMNSYKMEGSVKNLEALSEKRGELQKMTQTMGIMTSDLDKLQGKFNELGGQTKLDKSSEDFKEIKQEATNAANSLKDLANQLGLAEGQQGKAVLKDLDGALTEIENNNVDAGIEKIKSALTSMMGGVNMAEAELEELSGEMIELLTSGNYSEQALTEFANDVVKAAGDAELLRQAVEKLKNSYSTAGPPVKNLSTSISQLSGNIGMALGTLSMFVTSFQMFASACDENVSAGQKVMNVFTGLTMLIPAIITGISLLVKAFQSETMAKWADTVAQNSNNISKAIAYAIAHPLKAAIMLVTVATVAGTFATIANTKATKENTGAKIEEKDTITELIDAYDKLGQAISKFDTLAKGTDEWNQNLKESEEYLESIYELLNKIDPEKAREFLNDIEYDPETGYKTMSEANYNKYKPIIDQQTKEQEKVRFSDSYGARRTEMKKAGDEFQTEATRQGIDFSTLLSLAGYKNTLQDLMANYNKIIKDAEDIKEFYGEDFGKYNDKQYATVLLGNYLQNKGKDAFDKYRGSYVDFYKGQDISNEGLHTEYSKKIVSDTLSSLTDGMYNTEYLRNKYIDATWNKINGDLTILGEQLVEGSTLTEKGFEILEKYYQNKGIIGMDEKVEDNYNVVTDDTGTTIYLEDDSGNKVEGSDTSRYALGIFNTLDALDSDGYQSKMEQYSTIGQSDTIYSDIITAMAYGETGYLSQEAIDYINSIPEGTNNEVNMSKGQFKEAFGYEDPSGKKELTSEMEDAYYDMNNYIKGLTLDGQPLQFDEAKYQEGQELRTQGVLSEALGGVNQDAGLYGYDPETAQQVMQDMADMAKAGKEGYEGLNENSEALRDATTQYMRLNKAVKDINENYDDYVDVLSDIKKADKGMERNYVANSEGAKKLKSAVADLLNTSEKYIDADFLASIDPSEFKKAANGSVDAIKSISNSFIDYSSKATLAENETEKLKDDLNNLKNGESILTLDIDTQTYIQKLIAARMLAGASETDIENFLSGMQMSLDGVQFFDTLQEAQAAANEASDMVVDAMALDVEAQPVQAETEGVENDVNVEETVTPTPKPSEGDQVFEASGDGGEVVPIKQQVTEFDKKVVATPVPKPFTNVQTGTGLKVTNGKGESKGGYAVIKNAKKSNIKSPVSPGGGAGKGGGGAGKGGGGGGNSKPAKKTRPTSKKETVSRYLELTAQTEKLKTATEKASIAMDNLWGKKRWKAMKEYRKLLQDNIEVLKRHSALSKLYLDEELKEANAILGDKANSVMFGWEGKFGTLSTDADGYITNGVEVLTKFYDERHKLEDTMAQMIVDGATEEQITQFKEDNEYDKLVEDAGLIKDYIDTINELAADRQSKELEALQEIEDIKDNIVEEISEKIEIKVSINDTDLDILETELERLEMLNGKQGEYWEVKKDSLEPTINKALIAKDGLDQVITRYRNPGDEQPIDFEQVLKEADKYLPDILSGLRDFTSLEEEVLSGYAEVLDKTQERFDLFYRNIERASSKLSHYADLSSLLGKELDYDWMDEILKSQKKVADNQVQINKGYYEAALDEFETIQAVWNEKTAGLTQEQINDSIQLKTLQEKMKEANELVIETEENYLSSLQETADKAQAILENSLEKAKDTYEKSIFGEDGMDAYIRDLENFTEKQDRYLTTTNKLYETNRLIHEAQLEIDKTSNLAAKQRLNEEIKQIEALQEKEQVSQNDLDIAQAKFELAKAQIALEEAQNAKNQVRLTRDAEGNYGYVYTADQDKIAEAKQAVADAENNLYNLGLEAAKEAHENYNAILQEGLETLEEMSEELGEQLKAGLITEEEYNQKMLEARNVYIDKLLYAEKEYNKALEVLAEFSYEGQADYNFKSLELVETFSKESEKYIEDTAGAYEEFNKDVDVVTDEVGRNLDEMKEKTGNVTTESGNLADKINNEVLPAMQKQWQRTREVTSVMAEWAQQMRNDTIPALMDVVRLLNEVREEEATGALPTLPKGKSWGTYLSERIGVFGKYSPQALSVLQEWFKDPNGTFMDTNFQELIDEAYAKDMSEDNPWMQMLTLGRSLKLIASDFEKQKEQKIANLETQLESGAITQEEFDSSLISIGEYFDPLIEEVKNLPYDDILSLILSDTGPTEEEKEEAKNSWFYQLVSEAQTGQKPKKEETTVNNVSTEEETSAEDEPSTNKATKNNMLEIGDTVSYSGGDGVYEIVEGTPGKGNKVKIKKIKDSAGNTVEGTPFKVKVNRLTGYDTGGYTGDWGPEGKLALLHEKELVLNKIDTENLLKSVEIMRSIDDILNTQPYLQNLMTLTSEAFKVMTDHSDILQQEVTIHADFPNVTDHSEIEEAINNLINGASQYAHRNTYDRYVNQIK